MIISIYTISSGQRSQDIDIYIIDNVTSFRCTIRLLYYLQRKKQIPKRVYKHIKRKTQIQYYYHQYTTTHYTYILHHEEFFKVNKYHEKK